MEKVIFSPQVIVRCVRPVLSSEHFDGRLVLADKFHVEYCELHDEAVHEDDEEADYLVAEFERSFRSIEDWDRI